MGVAVALTDLHPEEGKFLEAIEFFNKPAPAEFIAGQIARLRVSMPRRAEENSDIEMLVDVMVEDCRDYPADIIAAVCKEWRLKNKWFPSPQDLRTKLEQAVSLRRSLLNAFRGQGEPLALENRKNARAASGEAPERDKNMFPKSEWTADDWAEYLVEAERMLALARENPNLFSVESWEKELSHRIETKNKVSHETSGA